MGSFTPTEAQVFLAETRVAVLSIPRPDKAPMSSPVWFAYEVGGDIEFIIAETTWKRRLLQLGTPVTITTHDDRWPYRWVSADCVVADIRPREHVDVLRIAQRYLGLTAGEAYAHTRTWPGVCVRLRPQRWLGENFAGTELVADEGSPASRGN